MTGSIALVGFMGAGKSRIGRMLAGRLGVPFVDTDKLITARHGAIAALFAEHGEVGFREIAAGHFEIHDQRRGCEHPRSAIEEIDGIRIVDFFTTLEREAGLERTHSISMPR